MTSNSYYLLYELESTVLYALGTPLWVLSSLPRAVYTTAIKCEGTVCNFLVFWINWSYSAILKYIILYIFRYFPDVCPSFKINETGKTLEIHPYLK